MTVADGKSPDKIIQADGLLSAKTKVAPSSPSNLPSEAWVRRSVEIYGSAYALRSRSPAVLQALLSEAVLALSPEARFRLLAQLLAGSPAASQEPSPALLSPKGSKTSSRTR